MDDPQSEHQQMVRRHHRERSELQARIWTMRNSIPKSDKRRRKQLLLDVARLEAAMEQKHFQEMDKFRERFSDSSNLEAVTEDLAKMDLENKPPGLTKGQRRRERRAAVVRECQRKMAESEMERMAGFHHDEEEKLWVILRAKNLEMKEIPADSHCMHRAIQDQLVFSVTVGSLRSLTADYMQKHIDDFLPFLTHPETGDTYSHDDFLSCCDDIVSNASRGGRLELRALSHFLQTPIEVIQADLPIVVIGEEYTRKPLVLVRMHYTCNLGDRYNSVKLLEAGSVRSTAPRLF